VRQNADRTGFESVIIDEYIGKGVKVTSNCQKEDFLLEYHGKLKDVADTFDLDDTYLYTFSYRGKTLCNDGTEDNGSLCRLVNDEHRRLNCVMKVTEADNTPHLCLFALIDLVPGVEMRYSYGDGDFFGVLRKDVHPLKIDRFL